jgi:hypothetical protein
MKYNDKTNFETHSVFKAFLVYFGMSLCIIPELILKLKSKNDNSEKADLKKIKN